jgi:Na+-transporting NADH:ubiquinone oxidoreductase subunit NqrB
MNLRAVLSQSPGAADPRLFQIATLLGLLVMGVAHFDLAASWQQAATTLSGALGAQFVFARWQNKTMDWRSPAITGLSLSLLLRTHDPRLWALSGAIAIGGKFLLRFNGKHLFNPACFAIVTLLLGTHQVWVSPGQWGALAWSAAALACAAGLVLSRAGRVDMALAFLCAWGALLAARCVSLGDPWTIPIHQIQSGALLIFACFMITDPRSTPDARLARILFAALVAALAHLLQFRFQIREGLFYALTMVSFTTPLLDTLCPKERFQWNQTHRIAGAA